MEGLEEVIDIRIGGKVSVDGLIRMMGASGGFTGRKLAEAVSWRKVKPDAAKMTVEGDATISLPIIYAALRERLDTRP